MHLLAELAIDRGPKFDQCGNRIAKGVLLMLGKVVTAVALSGLFVAQAHARVCEIGKPVQPISHWQQATDGELATRWCRVASLSGLHRMDVDKYLDKGWESVARASQQALDACTAEQKALAELFEGRGLTPPACPR